MKEKRPPLLCVDIGNTSVNYGIYSKSRFNSVHRVPTVNIPEFIHKIHEIIHVNPNTCAIISSVVPKITQILAKSIKQNLFIIGKNLEVPLKHNYSSLNKLGSDRQVNAFGGLRLYGSPLLILDFGTALTCDYISKKGVFEGGLIIPGPEIAWEALIAKAALLPKLTFPNSSRHTPLVGRNTKIGMQAGLLQGYAALADGLIEKFQAQFKAKPRAIATGGLARAIFPYSSRIDILDPLLTLKSLVEIFHIKIPA